MKNFIVVSGGATSVHTRQHDYVLTTSIGVLHTRSTAQMFDYLCESLKEIGVVSKQDPFTVPTRLNVLGWTVSVANPDSEHVLYALTNSDKFVMQTLCQQLSSYFYRHELRLSKRGVIRAVYVNGALVRENDVFQHPDAPQDW